MIEYLRSGESKVGYLNNNVERNMLHKENEVVGERMDDEVTQLLPQGNGGDPGADADAVEVESGLRRSGRKRKLPKGREN